MPVGGLIFVGIMAAVIAFMVWSLKKAPTCVCGREDCGGGCWPKKGKR